MAITINGNGTVTGATNMASAVTFGSTLATASRGINNASVPSGSIIQAVQTIKTDTFTSGSAETWTDITGMSASITPTSSTSKILVHMCLGRVSGTNSVVFRILRNSSLYLSGDAAGSRPQLHTAEANQGRDANHTGQCMFMYFDSPASTSSQTYQVQVRPEGSYFGLNRSQNDSDGNNSYNGRASSTLILMEIAQ